MKKFIIQAIALILVLFVALLYSKNPNVLEPLLLGFKQTQTQIKINENTLDVDIADSQGERTKGLSGRDSIAENYGMLFVFDKKDKYKFWMKDVKFPLDIIWIDGETIVEINEEAPPVPSNLKEADLPIYSPNFKVDKALEVKGGYVREHNINVGDKIEIVNK